MLDMAVSSGVTERNLPTIQPLTARNIVLSTLLGYHPPKLPIGALVRVAALFGVAERAVRTAASRMVAGGDLVTADGMYGLSDRLVARQVRQEADLSPLTTEWTGSWDIAVVTAPPRPLTHRVALRKTMGQLRLAELREGVWVRPSNLQRDSHDVIGDQCTVFVGRHSEFTGRDADDTDLVRTLWDLDAWAADARRLVREIDSVSDLKAGFMASALVIRHLLVDPCLPPELVPADWPGHVLRRHHAEFIEQFATALRAYGEA
jgi:phenylacetic acid degradation operon negative regulatory protein